jgi:hypothetical protein
METLEYKLFSSDWVVHRTGRVTGFSPASFAGGNALGRPFILQPDDKFLMRRRKTLRFEGSSSECCVDRLSRQNAGRVYYLVQTGPASPLNVLLFENQPFTAIEGAP